MSDTKGRRLLAAHFESKAGFTQDRLARKLGIRQPSVSMWVNGHSRPEHHYRLGIERLIGIAAESWLTEEETVVANVRPSEHPQAAEPADSGIPTVDEPIRAAVASSPPESERAA